MAEDPNQPDRNADESMDVDFDEMAFDIDEEVQVINEQVVPAPPPFHFGPHRVLSNNGVNRANLFNNDLHPGRRPGGRFIQSYRVMSARHLGNTMGHNSEIVESGGKVLLPQDALRDLTRSSSALLTPMLFKATNQANGKYTHCGVLEFTAEDNLCLMPSWMMEHLEANDRDLLTMEKVSLPTAEFVKFQAQSVDFLEITDQRAILENSLRQFACLTKGDMIGINYNGRAYKLCVLETQPSDAVTIIECNLNVDFEAPVGYVSPSESEADQTEEAGISYNTAGGFAAFGGSGNRLNGKTVDVSETGGKMGGGRQMVPDTEWKIGMLTFKRKFPKVKKAGTTNQKPAPFGGMGLSLKSPKK